MVANSTRDSLFRVTNRSGVSFLDSKGKPVAITDYSRIPYDITYFTFRANNNHNFDDTRAPDSVYLLKFSLRLPHTLLSFSASLSVRYSISNNNTSTPVDTFDSTLSKIYDGDFQTMSTSQMRQLLLARRNYLPVSGSSDVSRTL